MARKSTWQLILLSVAMIGTLLCAGVAGLAGSHAPARAQCYTPMVAAGYLHTVGLRSDGTVVAVGWNYAGQCNVGA